MIAVGAVGAVGAVDAVGTIGTIGTIENKYNTTVTMDLTHIAVVSSCCTGCRTHFRHEGVLG